MTASNSGMSGRMTLVVFMGVGKLRVGCGQSAWTEPSGLMETMRVSPIFTAVFGHLIRAVQPWGLAAWVAFSAKMETLASNFVGLRISIFTPVASREITRAST